MGYVIAACIAVVSFIAGACCALVGMALIYDASLKMRGIEGGAKEAQELMEKFCDAAEKGHIVYKPE